MDTSQIHPMAPAHIPTYVVAADGSDYLFTFMVFFTLTLIVLIGVAYFSLHALPEKMAHGNNHPQFQLVGILALLALFTHNNIFWVAAVLVAGFQMPDVGAPLRAIADAIRGLSSRGPAGPTLSEAPEGIAPNDAAQGGGSAQNDVPGTPRTEAEG